MSDTGLMVSIVDEPPSRYDIIIRVTRDGGQLPDPVAFAVAADQAASRRSAGIISVHMADTIINVVTVTAPSRYAALAVARAVVSDALKLQAPSPTPLGSEFLRAPATGQVGFPCRYGVLHRLTALGGRTGPGRVRRRSGHPPRRTVRDPGPAPILCEVAETLGNSQR